MSQSILQSDHYWLSNIRLDPSYVQDPLPPSELFDLEVVHGSVATIRPVGSEIPPGIPEFDAKGGMVWPCFIDMHTHLDKGHIWPRTSNPLGTFPGAITAISSDKKYWTVEDLYQRMEFAIRCSYAHGTQAIRTHLDAMNGQVENSLAAFQALRDQWRDRMVLQAVSLVPSDYFLLPEITEIADQLAAVGGILGAVTYPNPDLDRQLDQMIVLAQERNMNLDLHCDESADPLSMTLRQVAQAVLRHEFTGSVVCGHCCSLAVQPQEVAQETIRWVKEAGIGIVSLPMCNLYLQARDPGSTPRWRGVTLLHELRAAGIRVALANDNCRDPFFGFGDHDMLEVFQMGVRIAHLDTPYDQWAQAVTVTPAALMGLEKQGRIGVGLPADLVVFRGRNFSELLSRHQTDRIVLRRSRVIDTTLPDYAELDGIM